MIRNPGTVTVSYYTEEPWETLVAGQGFEFNDLVIYEDLEVGTVVQVESLAILALPEPTGWLAQVRGVRAALRAPPFGSPDQSQLGKLDGALLVGVEFGEGAL